MTPCPICLARRWDERAARALGWTRISGRLWLDDAGILVVVNHWRPTEDLEQARRLATRCQGLGIETSIPIGPHTGSLAKSMTIWCTMALEAAQEEK